MANAAQARGRLVVVSGPSGVGKSTIARQVAARTGAELSVSATTRPPRPGEVDGHDYRFVDRAAFDAMVRQGELLEWAQVHGNCYGTPRGPVCQALEAGRTVILEIDVQGGMQVAGQMPSAVGVLIVPPSDIELARRLNGRGTDSDEVVRRRLAKAREEIATAQASGAYQHTVVNDSLEAAVEQVARIVEEPVDS